MKTIKTQPLSFSINNWSHLYSLQKAIKHSKQLTGRQLTITGRLLNQSFLENRDTKISIHFYQSDSPPEYTRLDNDEFALGNITLSEQQLSSQITVDRSIFEELRKNLMEYADIEGIHIVVSLAVISDHDTWRENEQLNLVQLDYAMKGDA